MLLFLSFVVCVVLIDYGKIHKLNFNHTPASHNCILKNFLKIVNGFLNGERERRKDRKHFIDVI